MTEQENNKTKKSSIVLTFSPKEPGTFKLYLVQFLAVFIAAIILWPIFDIIYNAVFTHTAFVYTAHQYILQPLIFAIIFTIISYLIDFIRFKIKKSKK